MKPTEELSAAALTLAHQVAMEAYGPDVRVRPEDSGVAWHATLFRQLFEQRASVWTRIAHLDVIADETGEVIGYVDHDAYRRADDRLLDDESVAGLVADSELLPPRSRIVERMSHAGPEGGVLSVLVVEGQVRARQQRWLVEINGARRMIAAVRPMNDDLP